MHTMKHAIEGVGVRDLNPHCCRHTYINTADTRRLLLLPINPKGSARHTSYKTTLGYTHMPD